MLEQVLFKERMLLYKQMELTALSVSPNLASAGRQILSELFDLCFPWASREIAEEEQRKIDELVEMAKKFEENT